MATFSERAATAALKLIKAKGQQLTLTKRGADAVYDPAVGEFAIEGSPVAGTINAVVLPYTSGQIREMVGGGGADNTYVQDLVSGRIRKLLVAAESAPFEPEAGHEVVGFEGAAWEVLGSVPLSPAGTPILYTLAVRKK